LLPVSMLFWTVQIPGSILLFLGSWFLTMLSTLSVGLLVGGIAKNMKSASVIACVLYFPMLIFSGATLPFEIMPAAMQNIISIFPLTQGIQLMKATFLGLPMDNALFSIVAMGAVALLCFGISVKRFKWE
ncbi:MAG: ABC transporter permease, partial [Lachnospiraceae bacterium]|nr:ABC transporter permease [Lachnospiraceae bacterium]